MKMADESYNGWANWDTWATALYLDNTQSSSNWIDSWSKNFQKKIKKGTFDKEKARLVVRKYIIPAARGKGQWAKHFNSVEHGGFPHDESINPNKVDKDEIVTWIVNHYDP